MFLVRASDKNLHHTALPNGILVVQIDNSRIMRGKRNLGRGLGVDANLKLMFRKKIQLPVVVGF